MLDKTGPIEKPIILAICGKSCSGKTTLAKWLEKYFTKMGIPAHRLISCTTRPPRVGENEQDYYFMSEHLFERNKKQSLFLETTYFRKWHYGILKSEIKPGRINIGVFDAEGIKHLQKHKFTYTIVPIYLKQEMMVRLDRAYDREGKWQLEYFRRLIADEWSFRNIEKELVKVFNGQYIVLDRVDGVSNSSLIIKDRLLRFKVLRLNEDGRICLGNFI